MGEELTSPLSRRGGLVAGGYSLRSLRALGARTPDLASRSRDVV